MGTKSPFYSAESICPVCEGGSKVCCPDNCPPSAMVTATTVPSSPPCPLGISRATGRIERQRELQGCACVRGWARDGKGAGRAQPQSTAAWPSAAWPTVAQALRICQPVRLPGARLARAAWRDRHCSACRGPGASAFWCCSCWDYFGRPRLSAHGQ